MHHQRGADATSANSGQLFINNPRVPAIGGRAAKLLRITEAQQANSCRFGPELGRYFSRLIPLIRVGHDFTINKSAKRLAPGMMLLREMGVGLTRAVKVETHNHILFGSYAGVFVMRAVVILMLCGAAP